MYVPYMAAVQGRRRAWNLGRFTAFGQDDGGFLDLTPEPDAPTGDFAISLDPSPAPSPDGSSDGGGGFDQTVQTIANIGSNLYYQISHGGALPPGLRPGPPGSPGSPVPGSRGGGGGGGGFTIRPGTLEVGPGTVALGAVGLFALYKLFSK